MILAAGGWIEPRHFRGVQEAVRRRATETPSPACASLSWRQRAALALAGALGSLRRGDLMAHCGISREVARRDLAALVAAGWLERSGFGRGARYTERAGAKL